MNDINERLAQVEREAEAEMRCGYCGCTAGCYCACPTDKPPHARQQVAPAEPRQEGEQE